MQVHERQMHNMAQRKRIMLTGNSYLVAIDTNLCTPNNKNNTLTIDKHIPWPKRAFHLTHQKELSFQNCPYLGKIIWASPAQGSEHGANIDKFDMMGKILFVIKQANGKKSYVLYPNMDLRYPLETTYFVQKTAVRRGGDFKE